jgi:hypothetical protein
MTEAEILDRLEAWCDKLANSDKDLDCEFSPEWGWTVRGQRGTLANARSVQVFQELGELARGLLAQDGFRVPWVVLLDALLEYDRTRDTDARSSKIKFHGTTAYVHQENIPRARGAVEGRRSLGARPNAIEFRPVIVLRKGGDERILKKFAGHYNVVAIENVYGLLANYCLHRRAQAATSPDPAASAGVQSPAAVGAAPQERKRGRPSPIPDKLKEEVLRLQSKAEACGKKLPWIEAAKVLHATKSPTVDQRRNAFNIMKYYRKSRARKPVE